MTLYTGFGPDDWRRNLIAFGQPLFEGEHFLDNLRQVDDLKGYTSGPGRPELHR